MSWQRVVNINACKGTDNIDAPMDSVMMFEVVAMNFIDILRFSHMRCRPDALGLNPCGERYLHNEDVKVPGQRLLKCLCMGGAVVFVPVPKTKHILNHKCLGQQSQQSGDDFLGHVSERVTVGRNSALP